MLDNFTIQRIKDASNIVDVVRDFYDLKKKGTTYQCLCPFHDDRHIGSFVVNPRKNTFTCYSCGEHGNSIDFVMKHEGLTFVEAVKWLGQKYSIDTGDSAVEWKHKPNATMPHTPLPALPTLVLPQEMVKARQTINGNVLVEWLRSLNWSEAQRDRFNKILNSYLVGTSRQGHTIFWQVDEQTNVRTGKLMLYKSDGHRDKTSPGNFGWVHSRLIKAGKIDEDKAEMRQCLFGLHLLDIACCKTVNIVESEKTALICAIAYGNMQKAVWMATGGKTQLTREKLQPLIDRRCYIYLYPDHDATAEWQELGKAIAYERLYVNTDFMKRWWKPEDGDKADIGDVIVRLLTQMPETRRAEKTRTVGEVLADMVKAHPFLQTMIDKLDLKPTKQ